MKSGQLYAPGPVTRRKRLQKRKERWALCTLWRKKKKILYISGIEPRFIGRPAPGLFTTVTELSGLKVHANKMTMGPPYQPPCTWRFCTLAPNTGKPSVRNSHHVTLLAPSFIQNLCTSPAKCPACLLHCVVNAMTKTSVLRPYDTHCCSTRSSHLPKLRQISQQIHIIEQQQIPRCMCRPFSLRADSHIACHAHAVLLPCLAAKGLECVFPI